MAICNLGGGVNEVQGEHRAAAGAHHMRSSRSCLHPVSAQSIFWQCLLASHGTVYYRKTTVE